jgi:hypothetical protein
VVRLHGRRRAAERGPGRLTDPKGVGNTFCDIRREMVCLTLGKVSRSWLRHLGPFDLVLHTVVLCVSLVALVRALGNDDGYLLFISVAWLFTSSVWLVRIHLARRRRRRDQDDHQPSP